MPTAKKDNNDELAASKEAAMDALDKLLEARDHFRHAAESAGLDLKDEAIQQLEMGKAKVNELSAEASTYMVNKPLQTLGLAFLGGFIVAQFMSRK